MTDAQHHQLLKLMTLQKSPHFIAARMGWDLEETQKHIAAVETDAVTSLANGYGALVEQFRTMCLQYQLVGESLKVVGGALSSALSSAEIEDLWDADPKVMAEKVRSACIPLRRFVPPPTEVPSANQPN